LDKKEQDSLAGFSLMQNLYSPNQMWENVQYLHLQSIGLENYLNCVITRGVSLSMEGIVFVSKTLRNPEGMSEITRTKVGLS
jgi:hypothetical protein